MRLLRWFKLRRTAILIGLGMLVLTAEVACRIVFSEPLRTRSYPLIYVPDTEFGYRYIPGAEARICIPSICKQFTINPNGYYGPSFERRAPQGVYRIAVIGSSAAGGIWLNAVENFSMKLERLFTESGHKVQVVNMSLDGRFRDVQTVRLARAEAQKYTPDLLLLRVSLPFRFSEIRREVYKDYVLIYSGSKPDSQSWCRSRVDYIEDFKWLTTTYDASYLVRAAARRTLGRYDWGWRSDLYQIFLRKRCQAPQVNYVPYSLKRSLSELVQLRDDLQETGTELILFDYQGFGTVRGALEKVGLPYLELDIPFEPHLVHEKDIHYNEDGHHLIAERLFDALETIPEPVAQSGPGLSP